MSEPSPKRTLRRNIRRPKTDEEFLEGHTPPKRPRPRASFTEVSEDHSPTSPRRRRGNRPSETVVQHISSAQPGLFIQPDNSHPVDERKVGLWLPDFALPEDFDMAERRPQSKRPMFYSQNSPSTRDQYYTDPTNYLEQGPSLGPGVGRRAPIFPPGHGVFNRNGRANMNEPSPEYVVPYNDGDDDWDSVQNKDARFINDMQSSDEEDNMGRRIVSGTSIPAPRPPNWDDFPTALKLELLDSVNEVLEKQDGGQEVDLSRVRQALRLGTREWQEAEQLILTRQTQQHREDRARMGLMQETHVRIKAGDRTVSRPSQREEMMNRHFQPVMNIPNQSYTVEDARQARAYWVHCGLPATDLDLAIGSAGQPLYQPPAGSTDKSANVPQRTPAVPHPSEKTIKPSVSFQQVPTPQTSPTSPGEMPSRAQDAIRQAAAGRLRQDSQQRSVYDNPHAQPPQGASQQSRVQDKYPLTQPQGLSRPPNSTRSNPSGKPVPHPYQPRRPSPLTFEATTHAPLSPTPTPPAKAPSVPNMLPSSLPLGPKSAVGQSTLPTYPTTRADDMPSIQATSGPPNSGDPFKDVVNRQAQTLSQHVKAPSDNRTPGQQHPPGAEESSQALSTGEQRQVNNALRQQQGKKPRGRPSKQTMEQGNGVVKRGEDS